MAEQWASFFQRVKQRPPAFYEKCAARLESQDLYEPSDLADIDEEVLVQILTAPPGGDGSQAATAGEVTFLRQALELAKSDAGHPPKTLLEGNPQGNGRDEEEEKALAAERQRAEAAETKLKTVEAQLRSAQEAGATAAGGSHNAGVPSQEDDEDSDPAPPPTSFPVVSVLVPGNEDPKAFLERGGLELEWTGGARVKKFKEKPIPRIVDSDLALPTLYLHFLDARFLPNERDGSFDNGLRSGNDNAEIQIVLPAIYTGSSGASLIRALEDESLDADLTRCTKIALDFVKGHGEVETGTLRQKQGAFSPQQNYTGKANPLRLYFSLSAARPKAPINLDKKAWGIPENADLYLFAQNHPSVEHMSASENEAFQKCIADLPGVVNDHLKKLAQFLKVFYEGGFAYNHKDDVGNKGYIPRNVGVAGLGVVPAFPGQQGIATGYPFLLGSNFLRFTDTVPVTIPAITAMSKRHGRYGLCFTRCCFVWEDEAFEREGVLNFCSLVPFGGFFYVPSRLRDFRKLGGLLYAFGGAKEELELPLSESQLSGADGGGYGSSGSASAAVPTTPSDYRVCVLCLDSSAVMATIPCGHRAYCESCAPAAESSVRNCPVCRQRVTKLLRVY